MKKLLMLFKSTHFVLKAEKLCRENKLPYQIISIPKEISSECGMAIEINARDKYKISTLLSALDIEVTFQKVE